jgi:catechol 2,3-dioxygenase-like lactoylglutathione lyase family enzyme
VDLSGLTSIKPVSWLDPAETIESSLFEAAKVNNVQDVNGCVFRVFRSAKGHKVPSSALDDSLLYPSIIVRNLNDSLAFYCGVLGLDVWEQGSGQTDTAGGRRCALLGSPWGLCLMIIQSDEIAIAGVENNIWRKPGFTHLTLAVHQLDSYFTTLVKRGVKFWFSPTDLTVGPHSGGRLVFFTTPDGLVVELIDSPLTRSRAR